MVCEEAFPDEMHASDDSLASLSDVTAEDPAVSLQLHKSKKIAERAAKIFFIIIPPCLFFGTIPLYHGKRKNSTQFYRSRTISLSDNPPRR